MMSVKTDIYVKPTDSRQYLPYNSCHPKHVKINLPCNLAKRIFRIVSNPEIQQNRLHKLKEFLIKQSYPESLIEMCFKKAFEQQQNTDTQKPKTMK